MDVFVYSPSRLCASVSGLQTESRSELVPRGAGRQDGARARQGEISSPRGVQVAPTQLGFIAPKREKHLPCQSLFAQLCGALKAKEEG